MIKEVTSLLRRHEGYRDAVYKDTEGNLTVGVGHLLKVGDVLPGALLAKWFENDLYEARHDLIKLKIIAKLPEMFEARDAVLVMMLFNMGIRRVMGFKNMLAALKREDWAWAAKEMIDSKWARQVKSRAMELAEMMNTGEWPGKETP